MTNSLKLGAIVAGVMLLLATTAAVHAPTATATQFGRNLVRNGNAEANTGAASDTQIVRPADWRTTGQFTAVRYGIPGGFPGATRRPVVAEQIVDPSSGPTGLAPSQLLP